MASNWVWTVENWQSTELRAIVAAPLWQNAHSNQLVFWCRCRFRRGRPAMRHDTPRCIAGCLLETDTKKMRMNIHNADAAFAFWCGTGGPPRSQGLIARGLGFCGQTAEGGGGLDTRGAIRQCSLWRRRRTDPDVFVGGFRARAQFSFSLLSSDVIVGTRGCNKRKNCKMRNPFDRPGFTRGLKNEKFHELLSGLLFYWGMWSIVPLNMRVIMSRCLFVLLFKVL
jgi:hypothetical protein